MSTTNYFTDKVFAVTGAGSGMGRSIALQLAAKGAHVSLADISEQNLAATVDLIRAQEQEASGSTSTTKKILAIATDVRSPSSVDAWIQQTVQKLGKLHGCANFAGVINKGLGIDGIEDTNLDEWDFVLGVNLTGLMLCLRAQVPHMVTKDADGRGGSSIVNASSVAGMAGRLRAAAYVASKHGVIGLTRRQGREVQCRLGFIDTPMLRSSVEGKPVRIEEHPEMLSAALGRMASPDEVANLVLYLLSDQSSFVTGAVLPADGGLVC